MGVDAANELAGKSFEEKCEWIKIKKEIGNNFVKENKIEEALDTYLLSLCGFSFKDDDVTKEAIKEKDVELKVPILNNMALCLIRSKKYERALSMLDQVVKIDPKNEKAHMRKCMAYIEMVDYERANRCLK